MDATATIRMEKHEKETLTKFASFMGMSFSDWARQTLCEAYENYMDYQIALEAKREFDKNPVSYTAEEVERMFGDGDVDA